MVIARLAISSFSQHRMRVGLTIAAIAFAVSLVVAVTSGYRSIEVAAQQYVTQYLGSSDMQVQKEGDPRGAMPQSLSQQLRRDRDVRQVVDRLETDTKLLDRKGEALPGRVQLLGVRLPEDADVAALQMERGGWFTGDSAYEVVVDQQLAARLTLAIGDTITLPGLKDQLQLKVVGVVRKPGMLAQEIQTMYVPLRRVQAFVEMPDQVNRILIALKPATSDEVFKQRWEPRLKAIDRQINLRLPRETHKQMQKNLMGLQLMSYMGGAVSILAATFIIFSTLTMGVAERSRVLAMLRAVGAVKLQIGALVVAEAIVLAGVGIALGVPLGWLWIRILAWRFPDYLPAGGYLSGSGIAFGAGASLVAALLASLLPAYAAMRVSPLEALAPQGQRPRRRGPALSALAGLALIGVDPLLMNASFMPIEVAFYGHLFLGLPCLMVGYFLMAPAFVWMIERLFAWLVSRAAFVNPTLLRQQLSGSIWRAAGAAASLMVGLAVLVVLQTQGRTLMSGWRLPTRFPDMFIATPIGARLNDEDIQKLGTIPGIRHDENGKAEVLPIAIAFPGSLEGVSAALLAALRPDAPMFLGVDPDLALKMMELDFRLPDGKSAPPEEQRRLAEQATEMLKKGRHVIITDELRALKKINTGDKLKLKTPRHGDVEYTVAGVVWSPGIDVMVSMFNVDRMFEQRSASSVFGSLEDARNDFGADRIGLFAINLDYSGISKEELQTRIKKHVGLWGLSAGDVRHIKYRIEQGFQRLILLVSTVAIAAIAVASLGVTNTIMASVRTRRWQLGVLRSIGVTRAQLLRLVLAESFLLGLVGLALGLAAGMEMSFNANSFTRLFYGYAPPITVPWMVVGIGSASVVAIALLASIWPAASAALSDPLELLQAGRAGT